MDQLAVARRALEDEIAALSAEVQRLEGVLAILDRAGADAAQSAPRAAPAAVALIAPPTAPKKRGRPFGPQKPKATNGAKADAKPDSNIAAALKLIRAAGKPGIKALSLASLLKKSKTERPSKVELLESGSVKATGSGGGTTYHYVG